MRIETQRHGYIEVDPNEFLTFEEGIIGFSQCKQYAPIGNSQRSPFIYLQAITRPDVGFVVTDPLIFVPDYTFKLELSDLEEIGARSAAEVNILTIMNKVEDILTTNLMGPLIINPSSRLAKQLVLSISKYNTRHPIMQVPKGQSPEENPWGRNAGLN